MTTTKALLAAISALFASAVTAHAQAPVAFTVISPVFGQLVAFSMPSGFVVVSETANGPNYIREAVPKGETVDRWTQMITVTGVKGLAANPRLSPETFTGSIANGFRSACPDTFAARGFGATKFGDQDAYVAVAAAAGSSPVPTSTAKSRSSSPSKAAPITTRCNGPNVGRRPAEARSTRSNGKRGFTNCSRSGSARS